MGHAILGISVEGAQIRKEAGTILQECGEILTGHQRVYLSVVILAEAMSDDS